MDMVLDLVSIMPLFFDAESPVKVMDTGSAVSFVQFMRVLKIFRLLRLRRLLEYMDDEVFREGFMMALSFTFIIFFGAGIFHFVENLPDAACSRFLDAEDDDALDGYGHNEVRKGCEKDIAMFESDDGADAEEKWFKKYPNWTGKAPTNGGFMLAFHEAAYFVVVSMTTVGYGDINPSTAWSQLVTSVLILTTVVFVPFQTNQLLKVISEQAIWDKHSYFDRKGHRHVLVAGCVNNNGIAYFVHEFFNADQLRYSDDVMNMVILAPEFPASDVVELLGNPAYHNRLTYIAGSVLMDRDLHRASAAKAEAIWLLSNKFSDRPDEEDGLTVLRSLQLNTFMRRDAKLRLDRSMGISSAESDYGGSSTWRRRRRSSNALKEVETKIFTQLIQPENRNKLDITKRDDDAENAEANVLCIDEVG